MSAPILRLQSFGVSIGDREILTDVTFDLPAQGLTLLVGPMGCGKSTLLRTLAGLNDAHPSLVTWGTVVIDGQPIPTGAARFSGSVVQPAFVTQHARFFLETVRENLVSALPDRARLERHEQRRIVESRLEAAGLGSLLHHLDREAMVLPLPMQRRLAIARALMTEPRLLFADEPNASLEEQDVVELGELLREEARRRSVLIVTHNKLLAKAAGGTTVLLAGGRVQEIAPTERFFSAPTTEPGRNFVRTGGCMVPGPGAPTDDLPAAATNEEAPDAAPVTRVARSRFVGPRGFFWIQRGRLGGMPRPGIIDRLEYDIEGLQRLEVSVLVTLEENRTVDAEALTQAGVVSVHFPIVDMSVPEIEPTVALCRQVHAWMDAGEVVAYHCRAGLGRTGTLLACQLIWAGESARGALEAVRAINPRCIQSDAQVLFLRSFEGALREEGAPDGRVQDPVERSQEVLAQ